MRSSGAGEHPPADKEAQFGIKGVGSPFPPTSPASCGILEENKWRARGVSVSGILSYIIQKRFSSVNEDVATEALHFIVSTSQQARGGLMKLLRGIEEHLPELNFQTQHSENGARPDMWGYQGNEPRVFIENKFWAGLTDQQPVAYLRQLADKTQPSILLVVAPEVRRHTLWRELQRRLQDAKMNYEKLSDSGILTIRTEPGPILALTSWLRLLDSLSQEVADDPEVRSDLLQLRTLCNAADDQAFVPFSGEQITDQTTPAFLLQLGQLADAGVQAAVGSGILDVTGLRPQASWERIGRYARFTGEGGPGFWVGTHLVLWRQYGASPIWITFPKTEYGRGSEVMLTLESWASKRGLVTQEYGGDYCLALDVATGDEMDQAVASMAEIFAEIRVALVAGGVVEVAAR